MKLFKKSKKDIYDFDNDNDDVHFIDWDDDLPEDHDPDEPDETGAAEDYYSSRLSVDE